MIKIGCATKDKKNFTKSHFGEADYFAVYEYVNNTFELDGYIENKPFEEKKDGDPKKANHVKKQLLKKDVNVVANCVFGQNITRISKKFVAIVSRINNIEKALQKVDISKLENLLEKDNNKQKIVYLKNS